jgi:hypothetical protein
MLSAMQGHGVQSKTALLAMVAGLNPKANVIGTKKLKQ